jgi:hypothetical protein
VEELPIPKEHWVLFWQYSPAPAAVAGLAWSFMRKADKTNDRLVQALKDEIERVTQSPNRLEKFILKNRLSSQDIEREGES